jgi:hypothetical protein
VPGEYLPVHDNAVIICLALAHLFGINFYVDEVLIAVGSIKDP